MTIVFGNLPDNVTEKDIKNLMRHYKPSQVNFLKKTTSKHSCYECMVTLDICDPIIGSLIEQHYNNLCWKGTRISAHQLIF